MWRVHILTFIGVLAFAGPAAASETIPPGVSGAGQYTENVPGASGDKPSDQLGGGSGGSGSESGGSDAALPPGAAAALESLASKGPVGAAAAGLARAGADTRPSDSTADSKATGSGGEEGGSFLEEVFGQLTGSNSDGMGSALPIILALSVVAALLLALARRRRPERSVHP